MTCYGGLINIPIKRNIRYIKRKGDEIGDVGDDDVGQYRSGWSIIGIV